VSLLQQFFSNEDICSMVVYLPQVMALTDAKFARRFPSLHCQNVMSHSARNGCLDSAEQGQRQIDVSEASRQRPAAEGNSDEGTGLFSTSDQTRMTFADFLAEAKRFRASGGKRKLPYFGIHLLWRFKEEENGFLGPIGPEMADDLWSIHFDVIKEWQEMNVLPLVQRFYLFAGLGGTLYHCHYDLQPNLHVQLTGRKRFILFPPEDWPHLYPFPVHHDLDRRSMVDLDAPDGDHFPGWQNAHGYMVELEPGEALYIPPYWWHHVQSLTPETTSMAMWFFEHYPLSSGVSYGVGPRCEDVVLMRDIEEYIGKHFPDAPGEEDCTKARPIKAKQVAAFARWMLPRLGAAGEQPQPPPGLTVAAEEVEVALDFLREVEVNGLVDDKTFQWGVLRQQGEVKSRVDELLVKLIGLCNASENLLKSDTFSQPLNQLRSFAERTLRRQQLLFARRYDFRFTGTEDPATTNGADFRDPRSRNDWCKGKAVAPTMITTKNAPVCPPEQRELPGPRSGFGAVLNRHEENHDQRFFSTTSEEFYGQGSRKKEKVDAAAVAHSAGLGTEHEEGRVRGMKVGVLCGEAYNDASNPASNTRTQRSWLYQHDPSLKNLHHGGRKNDLPGKDNELSIPIGEGAMAKVRADLKARQG
ncbi:hif1an, partial [Symbiodinium sp. KB8]